MSTRCAATRRTQFAIVPALLMAVLLLVPIRSSAQNTVTTSTDAASPDAARAPASSTALDELTGAVAAERGRIAELQAELDRRSSALAEISARLDALAGATVPGPPPAEAAEASAQPRPDAVVAPRFNFYGHSQVRFASTHLTYDGCTTCPDRNIGRLLLRLGAEGTLAPGLRAVVGLGVGELNDPNTIFQTLGGNLGRKVATWDRGYVNYRPTQAPWIDLTAGKFPYTWLRSSMTFDVDFFPEGLSEKFSFDLRAGVLKNVSLQGMQVIINEQPAGPDTMALGSQFTATLHPGPVTTLIALTEFDMRQADHVLQAQIDGSDVGVKNTNATILANGVASYASGFRYANLIVENTMPTRWDQLPLKLGFEYQRNLLAVSDRDTAASLRLDAGRLERTGDWSFGWHIFRVEQDAIMSALGESDWRAPSNVLQHRFGVTRMLHPNVQGAFTWYRGRTLDRTLPGALFAPNLPSGLTDPWTNRFYLDIIYRY